LRGGDEGFAQRVRLAYVGHRERPAHPVQCISAARLVLGATEIGQDVGERPSGIAELPPVVEVFRLTADIEKTIDRARPAQHFPARLNDLAIVELRFGLRCVKPVDLGIGEELAVAEGNVNPDIAVVASGFQQQHAMAARRGETIGQHAPGRAGANNDVVRRYRVPAWPHDRQSLSYQFVMCLRLL